MAGRRPRFFLDTSILVYTFDASAPERRARAQELVEQALTTGQGIVSHQVIQEFLNVATRKFVEPLTPDDCRTYLQQVLAPLWQVSPTLGLYTAALDLQDRYGYGFYDSLILAAAIEAGCGVLYSEDLQNGQQIGPLTIVDPFA